MIDPVQAPIAATPAAAPAPSTADPSASAPSSAASPIDGAQNAAASSKTEASTQTAQGAGSGGGGGASDSQPAPEATQPLRLLIEHDKTTNQYVYKLYDSSGRIVREIPQESLADAQKQASGAPGSVFDTTV